MMAKLCRRMVMMRVILFGMACLLGQSAWACDEIVHRCTFKGGSTEVTVCLNADSVTYAYGPTSSTPDLALEVSIADADYTPWPGVGNSISEAVTFHNGAFSYEVYGGSPKLDENDELGPMFGGILISENNKVIARLSCDQGSVIWGGYGTDGIYGAKTDAGQCWEDFEWKQCK